MGPSVSAHRGHDPPGTVTDARLVRAPGRAAGGRAGNPSRGLPGHRNDVVHTPLRHATTSGGACVDRLWTLEPEAVTRHLTHCGRHESRCLLVIIDGGITSLVRQCLSAEHPGLTGGDRWVAHTDIGGHRRVGHPRRSSGSGWPGHRRWVVVTPARGGPGRGAGISENRSATSRSHRASSCCRRIHSASTIAAASSSRLVVHWVLVATSLTPFPECLRPWPSG
jgi:hypothetical protein